MKKLLIFLILLPVVGYSQGLVTTYPPAGVTGLTGNGTSITSTVPILLPNGSSTAPALSWSADSNEGFYRIQGGALGGGFGFSVNGALRSYFGLGFIVGSGSTYGFDSATSPGGTVDVVLARDAAATLALRNSTNAQTFNIYNTFTDTSNYGRFAIVNTTTSTSLISQKAGTGTGGFLSLQGSISKSLTDAAAAVSFVRIAVPTAGMIGGKVLWTAQSTDGTDQRTLTGEHYFSFADKAGTPTCGTPGLIGTAVLTSTNANTLACTITAAASTTNCDLQVTCTDNTAGSQTMSLNYRLNMPTIATVTPQ